MKKILLIAVACLLSGVWNLSSAREGVGLHYLNARGSSVDNGFFASLSAKSENAGNFHFMPSVGIGALSDNQGYDGGGMRTLVLLGVEARYEFPAIYCSFRMDSMYLAGQGVQFPLGIVIGMKF